MPTPYKRLALSEREADFKSEEGLHDLQDGNGHFNHIQKADVLQWFQRSTESDAAWVLNRLAETRYHLIYDAISEKMTQPSHDPSRDLKGEERKVRAIPGGHACVDPIIQFSSSIYYAEEGRDDFMVLDVMRLGKRDGVSEVYYRTEDDTALSGRSYVATSGRLLFNPGVSLLQIQVAIMNNDLWDSTTEFKVVLQQDGLKGAILGQYLYQTRVKIIDNDAFPTSDFKDLTSPEKVAHCSKWPLLIGYFRMVSNIPLVWQGTVKYILVDVVHNSWNLLHLFMTVYMLDFIIDTSSPTDALFLLHDRRQSLIVCSLITLAAVAIIHALDYNRVGFPIGRPARCFVQSSLLRKFLNYKAIVRERLQPGAVTLGMQRDAVDLVNSGYFNMLKMIKAFNKTIFMLAFKLLTPLVFGGVYDWHAFLLMLVIPGPLVIFLAVRENTTSKALGARNDAHNAFGSLISTITANFQLVVDYSLRNHCDHLYTEKQNSYASAFSNASKIVLNNMYFCKWCESFVIGIWILYGGLQVVNGSLSIGLFVTNLKLFETLGASLEDIYSLAVDMMTTFPALVNVVTLINHPTDVKDRYVLERAQRAITTKQRQDLRRWLDKKGFQGIAIDMMPIVLNFRKPFQFEGKDNFLNFMGTVEIHQGQMVAVAGPMGCGKATLLRLIVGSVLPITDNESPVFVPTHLRLANVADEPLFFGGSLYENLIFGMDKTKPDASLERVKSICKRLTRSHTITDYLDDDREQSWKDIFSGAQSKLLAIARALIQNSEVLCIHKPLAKLTHSDAQHVMQALHDHIDRKGLELVSDELLRRPRTVIVSAGSDRAVQEAHNVVTINQATGISLLIEEIPPDDMKF